MENTKILTEVQMKAIEDLAKAATNVINGIIEIIRALVPVVTEICRQLAEIWRQVIAIYPNKRVVTLALNHKDCKVRKKNRNRIIKWLRRLMGCKE